MKNIPSILLLRIKGHNIKAAGESAIILPNPKPTFNNTNLLLIVTYVRIFLRIFAQSSQMIGHKYPALESRMELQKTLSSRGLHVIVVLKH